VNCVPDEFLCGMLGCELCVPDVFMCRVSL
jgi:hypothetical protein